MQNTVTHPYWFLHQAEGDISARKMSQCLNGSNPAKTLGRQLQVKQGKWQQYHPFPLSCTWNDSSDKYDIDLISVMHRPEHQGGKLHMQATTLACTGAYSMSKALPLKTDHANKGSQSACYKASCFSVEHKVQLRMHGKL